MARWNDRHLHGNEDPRSGYSGPWSRGREPRDDEDDGMQQRDDYGRYLRDERARFEERNRHDDRYRIEDRGHWEERGRSFRDEELGGYPRRGGEMTGDRDRYGRWHGDDGRWRDEGRATSSRDDMRPYDSRRSMYEPPTWARSRDDDRGTWSRGGGRYEDRRRDFSSRDDYGRGIRDERGGPPIGDERGWRGRDDMRYESRRPEMPSHTHERDDYGRSGSDDDRHRARRDSRYS